jgi:hypothetical protein
VYINKQQGCDFAFERSEWRSEGLKFSGPYLPDQCLKLGGAPRSERTGFAMHRAMAKAGTRRCQGYFLVKESFVFRCSIVPK